MAGVWSLKDTLGCHMGTNDAVIEVHRLINESEINTLEDALAKWEELTGFNRSKIQDYEMSCIESYINAL